jgi:tetratricopeptide (TPR) repeat protein
MFTLINVSYADDTMRLYKGAVEAFKAGKYADALEKFKTVNQRRPDPVLDLNIGRCYEKLSDYQSALVHCKIALNHRNTSLATRRTAEKCVRNAEVKLAPADLTVRSIPTNATVVIDGKAVGQTPWSGKVASGRRQVDFSLSGYRSLTRYTAVKQGQSYAVTGVLVPDKVGALLSVTSVPIGSQVRLEGQLIGQTPIERYPVDARAYAIEITQSGFLSQAVTTTLSDGSHLEQTFNLVPLNEARPKKPVHWGAWTLMGTGGGLLATGVVFGVLAFDANLTADRLARTSREQNERINYDDTLIDSRQYATTADALYLAGSLLLSSGLTWALYPEQD